MKTSVVKKRDIEVTFEVGDLFFVNSTSLNPVDLRMIVKVSNGHIGACSLDCGMVYYLVQEFKSVKGFMELNYPDAVKAKQVEELKVTPI